MGAWKRTEKITHHSRGRLKDLRLVACVTADMTDLSMLCAAQMEEINSSKEEGFLTSAGTRLFKSSTVRFGSEVEVKVRWLNVGSELGNGDAWRDRGLVNLTTSLVYGRGRLGDETLRVRS